FPMFLVGGVLNRWQIASVAGLCTVLTEVFDSFEWFPGSGVPRDIMIFSAFLCAGMFVYEVMRNRQAALQHLQRIEAESDGRRAAEEQLKVLVESSPAAIFTTDSDGKVMLANDAAHRLFGLKSGALPGQAIRKYLPSLVNVPASGYNRQAFRTVMQSKG